jgi:sulfatase modifying factor 1
MFAAVRHVGRVFGFGTLLGFGLFLVGVRSTPAATPMQSTAASLAVLANAGVKTVTNPLPITSSVCGQGMVEVEGDFCPYVEQKCLRWLDPETKLRCAEFGPTSDCPVHTVHKHFCIDQYEYPNAPGAKPQVMITWTQAQKECGTGGKRLCGESEWTLACEGAERLPYPYGYARNAEACNIDKPHPDANERLIADPRTREAEVARLDQRDPSGAHDSCVSPFGAYDMTGNVDEWVVNESGHPHKSALKGGYWGPVRDRCRPSTTAHDENFAFYQIGFRCCSEPATAPATNIAKPAWLSAS